MTETLSTAAALVTLFNALQGWPLVVGLIIAILPALINFWVLYSLLREVRASMFHGQQRYDNNVLLVENYEKLAGELITEIRLSTAASHEMVLLLKRVLEVKA